MLGGIRSGKSQWAETEIARQAGQSTVTYIATGELSDADDAWARRIAAHRGRRPAAWTTVETGDVAAQLRGHPGTAALVDDLGGWLTGRLDSRGWDDGCVADDVDELLSAVSEFTAPLVLVSPEVGLSVVPATAAGRRFADELGTLNRRLADRCATVVLVIAGQPLRVKP